MSTLYALIIIAAIFALYYFFGSSSMRGEERKESRPPVDPAQFQSERAYLLTVATAFAAGEVGNFDELESRFPEVYNLKSTVLKEIWENLDDLWMHIPGGKRGQHEREQTYREMHVIAEVLSYELSELDLATVYRQVNEANFTAYNLEGKIKDLVDQLPSRK
ncbi:MAG: hypothetical protein WAU88_10870 [Candidatus Zixiibacteriota bacterium]